MSEPADKIEALGERVKQFQCMELPGQPIMMHMGTSYLVSDLWDALSAALRERDASLSGVWEQAQQNHKLYSATESDEGDIRFFGLGLAGEAGEVANFIKKRWRDGDGHDDALRAECADVLAYTMMLAWKLGMTPQSLIAEVARKQGVFVEKMEVRAALGDKP